MHGTYLSGKNDKALAAKFQILKSNASYLRIEFTTRSAFILAPIIDKEIVKIKASFLANWDIYLYNALFYHNCSI